MINLNLFGALGAIVLIVFVYAKWKIHKAKQQVDNIMRANLKLLSENNELKTEKAVVEQQVKNFNVKKINDETTHTLDHNTVVDELRKNKDLRCE